MKKSYLITNVLAFAGGSAACVLLAATLGACSGDDTAGQEVIDASPTPDATSPADASAEDAGLDATTKFDADAGPPSGDAGPPSADGGDAAIEPDAAACPVSVPDVGGFFGALASAVCQSLKACCGTGASFDTQTCLAAYGNPTYGGFLGVGDAVPYLDGGRIQYDTVAACSCLEGVATVNCGLIPQGTLNTLQQTCLQAIHGTSTAVSVLDAGDDGAGDDESDASSDAATSNVGAGSACASSYECVPGAFCTKTYPGDPQDAALGSCQPLVTDGGSCTSDLQCSYLANGDPALYCNGSQCAPRLDSGAPCTTSTTCASNNCAASGSGSICVSGEVFGTQAACAYLTLPDAGDGG